MSDIVFAPFDLRAKMREILKDYLNAPADVKETKNYWLKPAALALQQMPRFRVSGFVLAHYTGDLKKVLLENKSWFLRWRAFFTNHSPMSDSEYEQTINTLLEKVQKLPFPDYFITLHSELLRNFGLYECIGEFSETLFMRALQAGYNEYQKSEFNAQEKDDLYDCIELFTLYVKNWFGGLFYGLMQNDRHYAYKRDASKVNYPLKLDEEKHILKDIKKVRSLIRRLKTECPECTFVSDDLQSVNNTLLVLQQKTKLN